VTAGRPRFTQVKRLADRRAFAAHLEALGVTLPLAAEGTEADRLGAPWRLGDREVANRWAVLPMEGWDGDPEGRPTELVRRRWRRFGRSGAALIWGGEAVAVRPDGRANPRQLGFGRGGAGLGTGDLAALRAEILAGRREVGLGPEGLLLGLQLTHSGRWSRPEGRPAPRTAWSHPVLDARAGAAPGAVLSDAELDDLIGAYAATAGAARDAGFDFVDVKACHGYLVHELLAARDRPGPYGGDLAGRARFLLRAVTAVRDTTDLAVGVRLSAFDVVPHRPGPDGTGVPEVDGPWPYAFGGDGTGAGIDLTEVHELCRLLVDAGVRLLCVTAGSPYTCPHVQRPAAFPPSDGYRPPRDPLCEVARLVEVTGALARAHPELVVVASGLSYLQEWLPAVAAGIVATGTAAVVGYGRGVLAYPELPGDVLGGRPLDRRRLCRTFSDCTTAPRHGLVSGCYPLDPFYRARPEWDELARVKRARRSGGGRP
jgi:2,4-dienoyl-CoA reductase-like NADH-dependent reductase (Old Yellow Enzyme family)